MPRVDVFGTLREVHRDVRVRRESAVCLVCGAPGIGKTHLVRRFLAGMQPDVLCLEASGLAMGGPPLLPICQALASNERQAITSALGAILHEYAQSVPILKETLGPLLRARHRIGRDLIQVGDLAPRESHTFLVLARMFRAATHRASVLILFVDDVQWLDESSASFLGYLAHELRATPLQLVVTARTNGIEPAAMAKLDLAATRRGHQSHKIRLQPLDVTETIEAAERMLGGRIECTVADAHWLQHTTRGNPRYLHEVLQLLKDDALARDQRGTWRFCVKPESLVLPSSVRLLIMSRAEAIDSGGKAVLGYAAALGRADASVISQALGVSIDDVVSSCRAITKTTGLLKRVGTPMVWAFDHDLTREAILDDLAEDAPHIHIRIANVLASIPTASPLTVARHFESAGEWTRAADYYLRAADTALVRYMPRDAVAAARQAQCVVAHLPSVPIRSSITSLVGRSLVAAHQFEEAICHFESNALEPSDNEYAQAMRAWGLAELNLARHDLHVAGAAKIREAAQELEARGSPEAIRSWADATIAFDAIGDQTKGKAAFRHALTLAKKHKDLQAQSRLLRLTCIFWQPEKVLEATDRALALARKTKDVYGQAQCHNNLATQRFFLEDLKEAEVELTRSLKLLDRCGKYRAFIPTNNQGLLAWVAGDLDSAESRFRQALDTCDAPNDGILIRSNLAAVAAVKGSLGSAAALFEGLARDADIAGDVYHMDVVRHNWSRVLLMQGKPRLARSIVLSVSPRTWLDDGALVVAKRAVLLLETCRQAGDEAKDEWKRQAAVLSRTTKRQAWLYRLPWELSDLQFWLE